MANDWLPRRRSEQLEMAKTWVEVVGQSWEDWDMQEQEVIDLGKLYRDARFAFDQNNGPAHGTVTVAKANTAFKALVRFMRDMRRRRFFMPPLTAADIARLRLRMPDDVRTEHTVVTEIVDFVIHVREARQLSVDFWIQGAAHKAKPTGYDGAVVVWGFFKDMPHSHTDLTNHTMASRTPHTIHFDESDRGKTVWIALAWQNERGILGEWSVMKNAIVP